MLSFPLFAGFRQAFRGGYRISDLGSDLLSGIVVGLVAVPLGMALAIASGVPPQYGLYTVIFGGFVVALFGGSRFQVSGPTAAFVVILAPITQEHGLGGLLVSGFIAGILLLVMGMAHLGKLIQYIPYSVKTGFTAGIGVVIGTLQLKDFFGIHFDTQPTGFILTLKQLVLNFSNWQPAEFSVAATTLLFLIAWLKINRRIPAPLVSLSLVTVGTVVIHKFFPAFQIATIGSRFNGIPSLFPHFDFPWNFPDQNGQPLHINLATLQDLFMPGFTIAMLGAIESLLSAVVADGITHTKHDPDNELIAQGIGNFICPFFGGIASTGAIARTATNIRFGAKSPFSAIFHSLFVLFVVVVLARFISYLPMAALAALLIYVAWMMSDAKRFLHLLKVAPPSDIAVLLICFLLTIIFNMVAGVCVGMVLAAFLFMKRMAALTTTELAGKESLVTDGIQLPKNLLLYRIHGPLFFGAADHAIDAITDTHGTAQIVLFDMKDVPMIDASGLVALEHAMDTFKNHLKEVAFCELQRNPYHVLNHAGFFDHFKFAKHFRTVEEAIHFYHSS